MAKIFDIGKEKFLTPEELGEWLKHETALLELAQQRKFIEESVAQSRIQEAKSFVEAYGAGKITMEQADEAHTKYIKKWPSRLVQDEGLCRSLEEDAERKVTGTTRRERLAARSAERGGRS